MAYGLPVRGQHDYDDELNNSIEYLRGQADSAKADANNAVSTANAAYNLAQSVTGAFTSVAAMLADGRGRMGVGSIWRAGRHTYAEADSAAVDHHLTTAGGVKLYVLPKNGSVELAAWGVDGTTTSVTGQLLQAATVAKRVILPAATTLKVNSKPTFDADLIGSGGSALSFQMTSGEGFELAAGRSIKGVKFTSPYTGPASAADAVDATAGGKYDYGSRSLRLNAYCHVEDFEMEYAAGGILVAGTGVVIERFNIHDIHHYKGWGAAIHRADSTATYGHVRDGFITDCDRGTETETGASYNLVEDVTYTRVGPFGYPGQGAYEVYTFVLDSHSHDTENPCVGNVYRRCRVVDCMGAITCVRSSGTSDSNMPRGNTFEDITIEGYAGVTGYEAVYLQGHGNAVKRLRMLPGSGVTSKAVVFFAGGGSSDSEVEVIEASGFALPLVQVGSDNTTTDNKVTLRQVSAPSIGTGYLVDVYGKRTQLDLSIRDVTGTTGYVRFNSPAINSKIVSMDYTVATAETFAQVVLVSGTKHVQIHGMEGYNYATVPPKDIATSGGVTNLTVRGNNIDRSGGISVDLGGATVGCTVSGNDLGSGKVNDAGTNNTIDRPGPLDFESTFGNDPATVALALAGGSVNLATANQATVVRLRAQRRLSISKLRWMVGTQSGNYDIAILDYTGKVLWAKGSTAVPAAGLVEESFTAVNIDKGAVYYVGIVFDNTTATLKGLTLASANPLASLTGKLSATYVGTSFPFPAVNSTVAVGTTPALRLPVITVHEA